MENILAFDIGGSKVSYAVVNKKVIFQQKVFKDLTFKIKQLELLVVEESDYMLLE